MGYRTAPPNTTGTDRSLAAIICAVLALVACAFAPSPDWILLAALPLAVTGLGLEVTGPWRASRPQATPYAALVERVQELENRSELDRVVADTSRPLADVVAAATDHAETEWRRTHPLMWDFDLERWNDGTTAAARDDIPGHNPKWFGGMQGQRLYRWACCGKASPWQPSADMIRGWQQHINDTATKTTPAPDELGLWRLRAESQMEYRR